MIYRINYRKFRNKNDFIQSDIYNVALRSGCLPADRI